MQNLVKNRNLLKGDICSVNDPGKQHSMKVIRHIIFIFFSVLLLHLSGELSGQSFFVSIRALSSTNICQGDSVEIGFWFWGGSSPYTLTINNKEGEYIILEDIEPSYTFYVKPDSDDSYYVGKAVDSRGREGRGYGSVSVTVTPSTPVSIVTDRTVFLANEPGFPLVSEPPGATFSGKGVSGSTFYPAVATSEGSPHLITCRYENQYGCVSEDRVYFYVLSGKCSVNLYSGGEIITIACDDGADYTIKGSNEDNLYGTFELFQAGTTTPVPGHIVDDDLTDNEADLIMAGLTGAYDIVYSYGMESIEISTTTQFEIYDIGFIGIQDLPDTICQQDPPYPLMPEVSIEDPDATFTFSGPGVSGNQADGFYLDPGDPTLPVGSIEILLEYTSSQGCMYEESVMIFVGIAPMVEFIPDQVCLLPEGSMISFTNLTGQKELIAEWNWDFGDPASGVYNTSNLENPEHFYTEPGPRTIILEAITHAGCQAQYQLDTMLVDRPLVDFTWDQDCYTEDQATTFIANPVSLFAGLDTIIWTIRNTEGSIIEEAGAGPEELEYAYLFSSMDPYDISLYIENEVGCHSEITKRFELLPVYVLADEDYMENFNDISTDWKVGSDDSPESWILGEPDFAGFNPVENDLAWYTDLPADAGDYLEHSWVRSPCFDFSGLTHPVIQLDMMKSFVPGIDGAVLQYQDLVSEGWKTIGTVGGGMNWYNDTAIYHQPGGSRFGWSLVTSEPDHAWVTASNSLEVLAGNPRVKFRLVIATGDSREIAPGIYNQGFAFDNFFIKKAILRRSVLEYFTNAAGAAIYPADSLVEDWSLEHTGYVYDLHYHMDYPEQDPMHEYNPHPPSTRAFNYGVPGVPYAVLNGGVTPEYRFDLSPPSEGIDDEVLIGSSMETPLFELSLAVDYLENRLEGTATVVCLTDDFDSYLQLYIVIIEQAVTSYPVLTPDSSFRNVVLAIWPDAAGTLLGNQWSSGTMVETDFTWDYVTYLEDVDDLSVVAFVQDRDNKLILQADALPKTPFVGIPWKNRDMGSMVLYPNPARDYLTVHFGERSVLRGELVVIDIAGQEVLYSDIRHGSTTQVIDISAIPEGIYMVIWKETGIIRGQAKLVRY